MKLDLISIVVLVFCLGICMSLFVEVKAIVNASNIETAVTEAN